VGFGTDLKLWCPRFESRSRRFYLLMVERRREWGTKTRLIHDLGTEDDGTLAVSPPVNQTSTFELASPEEGASLATEVAPATYYTRCCNPNTKGYQQTVSKEQLATWGTNLDLLVAFALGVLAHRIVRSLTSAGKVMLSFLRGREAS
jgi:cystathionine beta-lyase/cystathionine gamma-synthase